MAKSLNIVIGANIDKLRDGMNQAVMVIQSSSKKMSADVAESAKSITDRLSSIATKNPTMGTVRQLTQLAMETRALGPEFANMANQIIQEAGHIKDSIADTRGEVAYFASDTRRLDAVLGGIQGVAGAFGAVQGAAALFGNENKNLQETLVKLQAAIALVNGVQSVQNALQAESAVRQGLSAAATAIYTAATNGATIATKALNLALAAGPWVLITASIAAFGALLSKLASETKAVEKNIEKLKEAQDSLLSNGEKKIRLEERRLEIAIATAKAEGKNEAYILDLKRKSLATQKALYKKAGEDALLLLNERRSEELRLAGRDEEAKKNIYAKYEKESLEIRTRLNEEYQNKLHAFELDEIEGSKKVTQTKKANTKEATKAALEAIEAQVKAQDDFERFQIERNKKLREKAAQEKLKSKEYSAANLMAGTAVPPVLIQVKIDPKSYSQVVQDFDRLMNQISEAVSQLGVDIAVSLGETIGNALSGQKDVLASFGDAVITALGGFMTTIGKLLITYAIGVEKFRSAFADWKAALAAGIALVAIGTTIRNTMTKGPSVPAFAEGGIVSGPTLGLMGEYPGARSNPEVIAPLSKLKSLMQPNDSSAYIASTHVSGRDLAIVLNRYNSDSKRG